LGLAVLPDYHQSHKVPPSSSSSRAVAAAAATATATATTHHHAHVPDDATVEYEAAARPPASIFSAAIVRYEMPDGTPITLRLDSSIVIGSGEHSGIRVVDRLASRVHAEIELRDDGAWVKDLGSKNGTFVNGVRVSLAQVPAGGTITIGNTRLTVDVERERRAVWPTERFGTLVGRSAKMRELFLRLSRVASADAPVLINGETGTGKEVVARAIHEASKRSKRPFVVVDCGALPANLLESELFGHAKGAFTGAVATHLGAVEVAAEGTIFLDEIGELPLEMQPKLLRALESNTFRRVGETEHRPIRARFVAATHRNLAAMVNAGTFREDLYYRLAVLPVHIPALRERPEDIPLLVEEMLKRRGSPSLGVPVDELITRAWVGNVRELRSFIERACTLGPEEAFAYAASRAGGSGAPGSGEFAQAGGSGGFPHVDVSVPFKDVRDRWVEDVERTYVANSLDRHGGNVTAVAESAGLARSYVHRLIRKHSLDR